MSNWRTDWNVTLEEVESRPDRPWKNLQRPAIIWYPKGNERLVMLELRPAMGVHVCHVLFEPGTPRGSPPALSSIMGEAGNKWRFLTEEEEAEFVRKIEDEESWLNKEPDLGLFFDRGVDELVIDLRSPGKVVRKGTLRSSGHLGGFPGLLETTEIAGLLRDGWFWRESRREPGASDSE